MNRESKNLTEKPQPQKKYARWTWLNERQWNYWLVHYHLKTMDSKKRKTCIRISHNRLEKFLKIPTHRGEHHIIARYYWAKLWNLKLDQTWQELSDIENKYRNTPASLPTLLNFELMRRMIKTKKITVEQIFAKGQKILTQQ